MATIKREYVFITSILTGLAALLSVVSFATEQWVHTNKLQLTNVTFNDGRFQKVHYGLFGGVLQLTIPYETRLPLTITCLAKDNVCAFLCNGDSTKRYNILKNLYNMESTNDTDCTYYYETNVWYQKYPFSTTLHEQNNNRKFINCGVWVSTIIFLAISILFGVFSTGLSIYNTVSNPVQLFLSIFAIYIYNGLALFSSIVAIILWGVMYNIDIYHDIAIFYTLNGDMTSEKNSQLGYSYWLNLGSIVLYIGSICVLYFREYQISRDPKHQIVQREDAGDPVIYLY